MATESFSFRVSHRASLGAHLLMSARGDMVTKLTELPPTISVEDAGEILGISRRAAYRAAERGEIPTFRIGRRLLVPTAKLLGLLGVSVEGEVEQDLVSAS